MAWAEYIASDLRARIEGKRELPDKLTLGALAGLYEVSITPVRTAVRNLTNEGLIRKGRNGRLTLNPRKAHQSKRQRTSSVKQPPENYFDRVTRDLVLRSFKGQAVFLREQSLTEQYKISRTLVRQILSKLTGTGIVDHVPRRGWRLRPFTQHDLDDFLAVREVLELKALDLARNRLEKEKLQAFLARNRLPAAGGHPEMDNSLHAYIIENARNRYIRDFFEHYGKYYEVLFAWEDCDHDSAVLAVRQHRAILKALLKKDWPAARRAMTDHIRNNHAFLKSIGPDSVRVTSTGIVVKT
jgi:DNA-binding GntR family transcriptional regulator